MSALVRIAISGRETQDVESIKAVLERYRESRDDMSMELFCPDSEDMLLERIRRDRAYSLFVVSTQKEGNSGSEVAQRVRGMDADIPIVFVADDKDFTFEAFRVSAIQYFIKPVSETQLFPLLDRILAVTGIEDRFFELSMADGIVEIPFSSIEFMQVIEHRMRVYLQNGDELIGKSLRTPFGAEIIMLLKDMRFLQTHRSAVVNFEYVRGIDEHSFIMKNGMSVPIFRNKMMEVKGKYFEWRLRRGLSTPKKAMLAGL